MRPQVLTCSYYQQRYFSNTRVHFNDEYRIRQNQSIMNHFSRPNKRTIAAVVGGFVIAFGGYAYWIFNIMEDSEVQLSYWEKHEQQFVLNALTSCLQTMNRTDHKQWLLENALDSSEASASQIEIVMNSSSSSAEKPDTNPNYRTTFDIDYHLLADVCDVDNIGTTDNTTRTKIRLQRCRTHLNTREITVDCYFLIASSDQSETRKAVKVTMIALDTDLSKIPNFFVTRVALCSVEKAFPDLQTSAKKKRQWENVGLTGRSSDRSLMEQKLSVGGEIVLERAISNGGRLRSTNGITHVHI
jgi:hypothetical protein